MILGIKEQKIRRLKVDSKSICFMIEAYNNILFDKIESYLSDLMQLSFKRMYK